MRACSIAFPVALAIAAIISCSDEDSADEPADAGHDATPATGGSAGAATGGSAGQAGSGGASGSTGSGGSGGSGGKSGVVGCAGEECDVTAGEYCCMEYITGGSRTCNASGEACNGATIHCDGLEDCSAGECCGILNAAKTRIESTQCKPSCGADEPRVCSLEASGQCGSLVCVASRHLPVGYGTCK